MDIATLRGVLLWCTLINFGFLALWGLLMALPHRWLYRIWGRVFRLTDEQFDAVSFCGLLLYKVLILVFNAVPYVALLIVGGGGA